MKSMADMTDAEVRDEAEGDNDRYVDETRTLLTAWATRIEMQARQARERFDSVTGDHGFYDVEMEGRRGDLIRQALDRLVDDAALVGLLVPK